MVSQVNKEKQGFALLLIALLIIAFVLVVFISVMTNGTPYTVTVTEDSPDVYVDGYRVWFSTVLIEENGNQWFKVTVSGTVDKVTFFSAFNITEDIIIESAPYSMVYEITPLSNNTIVRLKIIYGGFASTTHWIIDCMVDNEPSTFRDPEVFIGDNDKALLR